MGLLPPTGAWCSPRDRKNHPTRPKRWISEPRQVPPEKLVAFLAGGAVTVLLVRLRETWVSWPLHPIGFAVASNWGMQENWCPFFVAWLLKAVILHYGGLRGYRTALPFFIGMVLGEFAAGFVRTLLDLGFGLYLPPGSGIGGL